MSRIQKTKTPAERKAAAEARSAETKSARAKAAERKLAPLAKEINSRLEKAVQMEGKGFDHRLAAALRLADAQKKCKELGLTFKAWAETNVKRSIDEVYRLATVGGAKDPRLALENMRAGGKARQAKHRAAVASCDATGPASEAALATPPKSKFLAAEDSLLALDDKSRAALLEKSAGQAGMRVVPEAKLKVMQKQGEELEELRARTTSLEFLKEDFARLGASSKVAFVEWSAHNIGATVKMPDFTKPIDVSTPPAGMDRRPAAKRSRRSKKAA